MKKILILAVAALLMGMAKADYSSYLYWNIGSSTIEETFGYAKLKWTLDDDTTGYLKVETEVGQAEKVKASGGTTGSYFSDLSGLDSEKLSKYSFMAEAYDASGMVGTSVAVLYADLVEAGGIYTDMDKATAYSFTISVPEPTSGLLLLLGVAGLALRRKKR